MPRRVTESVEDVGAVGPQTKADLRQEALNGVLQIGQLVTVGMGQLADAGAIGMFGPPMVNETVKLAENNAKVARMVDLLVEVGPYAGILAAGIPFLAQILVNHKVIPAETFANAGVVTPDILAEQMKMTLMKQALEAQREQMRMMAEMQAMKEEMENEQRARAANLDDEYREQFPND